MSAVTDQADQLSLFCPTCCGALVVVAEVPNHDGDLVAVPAPCPTCRPRPAAPETWRAAVELARRLVAEVPAAGRSVAQDGRSRPPA